MRTTLRTLILSAAIMVIAAGSAFAAPVLGPGLNKIFFNNFENVILQEGQEVAGVGSTFYGILTAQNITNLDQSTTYWNSDDTVAGGFDTLTGYFLLEVTSIDGFGNFIFGAPSTDPNGIISDAELGDEVVLKLYADSTESVPDAGTVADGLTTYTDGNTWLDLTLDGGYWWSTPTIDPTSGLVQGDTWFGLNYYNSSFADIILNDPAEALFDLDVNLYGESTFQTNPNAGSEWAFISDDPAVLATPEPGTLLITGAGLLGLAGFRRRQKKNAAA
ncbi:PEP-CTERM sorting domain-containing protein [Desulfohalovibrio reitneri]|uniref:PEP-CTERM sorting domain-containing protein n=1 Tax=Desulfohalovibrio reitneri TaxID=1307759 RepID=UPI0004A6CA36|nr:PEP-CTERM sorting domain-containing protein [Desulfohalovibrio reitneri]